MPRSRKIFLIIVSTYLTIVHSGQILKIRTLSGVSITTNQKEMLPDNDGRTVAIWEAALEELLHYHMITALGTKGEVFQLTKYGYDHNDLLQKHHGWIF